ncbi:unnamed protein product [Fructobacillus fructosus]|uniref:Uncharacterized protein n=1 Tax=Fructobacillus fructosus TaxID=1631 RepID=A0ABN9YYU6_9LACO|nr:unnamed protein product [Fructobacillus fructosus]
MKDQKEFKENTLKSIESFFENFNLDQIKVKRVFDEKNKPTDKVDYILSLSKIDDRTTVNLIMNGKKTNLSD